jgi:hypothetical protein
MTTDWRERLREKIAANPSASSGPPIEVSEVVGPLDDAATLRSGAMELKYNSVEFLGLSPRHLQLLSFGTAPIPGGQVELSLRFRYFRSGSVGAGSKLIDETSEADFNALP